MKRVLSLFLSVLMLTSVVAAVDLSAYAASSSKCGSNVTWSLSSSGTLTISGTGDMANYYDDTPWYSDRDSIENVVINSGVTSIGDYAFYHCTSLTSVTIPNSVTSIGSYAFCYCESLTSVTIPNSVTSIEGSAFDDCSNLKNVKIGSGVKSIDDTAFYLCESLKSFSVSSGNKYFKSSDGVLFNKDKTKLVRYTTGKSGSYTIPKTVKSIGKRAFAYSEKLTSVIIPNSVTKIGEEAFYDCEKLTSVTIPSKVTKIEDGIFFACESLKSVTIPKSVTSIDIYAFTYTSLKDVYYTGSKSQWNKVKIGDFNDELTYAKIHYNHSHTYKVTKATTNKNGSKKCSVCGAKTIIYKPKTISLSNSSFTYTGNAKKPTVKVKNSAGSTVNSKYYTVSYINRSTGETVKSMKNVGKYYVKVKFKGSNYSGSLKKKVTIKPKATSISGLTATSKGFTVKWNKQATKTSGYQVQYSTSSSFKNAKTVTVSKNSSTSKKITGLSANKKYYVRVRTYKTIKLNNKNTKVYSSWSSKKSVTTKK